MVYVVYFDGGRSCVKDLQNLMCICQTRDGRWLLMAYEVSLVGFVEIVGWWIIRMTGYE